MSSCCLISHPSLCCLNPSRSQLIKEPQTRPAGAQTARGRRGKHPRPAGPVRGSPQSYRAGNQCHPWSVSLGPNASPAWTLISSLTGICTCSRRAHLPRLLRAQLLEQIEGEPPSPAPPAGAGGARGPEWSEPRLQVGGIES